MEKHIHKKISHPLVDKKKHGGHAPRADRAAVFQALEKMWW
jgi:hypothetical protein